MEELPIEQIGSPVLENFDMKAVTLFNFSTGCRATPAGILCKIMFRAQNRLLLIENYWLKKSSKYVL